ncbi:MAG: dehydrogenase containing binding domain [Alphaproteobacteria bacterium]|jgi:cytokinin dehydrogenase|nr:dehydrogenase containing binding domain [Alphaproteobacteria bacterium]
MNSNNPWTPEKIEECQSITGISFSTSKDMLSQAAKDFGGLLEGHPVGVAYPHTATDIAALLSFANQYRLGFTVRSGGYSQGGQTLAPQGGATLDCSRMTHIEPPNGEARTLVCQPGATWGQAVAASAPSGLLPKVMPFFPNLTVGGVLSIGGIGGNSHLYGCVSGNVRELEVVTGSALLKTCSVTKEPDLFEATLCGLGRCSVISKVTLELRPYKPNMVTYYLLYADHKAWLADIQTLREDYECDYLEAFCTPSLQGLHKQGDAWKPLPCWLYNLQVSFEHGGQEERRGHQKILDSLGHWRLLHTEISNTLDFVGRYGVRAQNMKATGSWHTPHPWFECMLPLTQFSEILPELLNRLPLSLGDGLGYRLFCVGGKNNMPVSFRMPAGSSLVVGFAALPASLPEQNRSHILDSLESIHEWLISLGGKRGLSGWLGSNPDAFWQQHYEAYYQEWKELKKKYDPHKVLQSILLQTVP